MKKILFFLFFINYLYPSFARDPFDKTQRTLPNQSAIPTTQNVCSSNNTVLAENTPFQQLQLVGIVKYQNKLRAIFTDSSQQINIGEIGNLISQEKLKITEISSQKVKLFDCQQTRFIYIKL